MAWYWPSDKQLSEPMLFILLILLCVTQPQWVTFLLFIIYKYGYFQLLLYMYQIVDIMSIIILHWQVQSIWKTNRVQHQSIFVSTLTINTPELTSKGVKWNVVYYLKSWSMFHFCYFSAINNILWYWTMYCFDKYQHSMSSTEARWHIYAALNWVLICSGNG